MDSLMIEAHGLTKRFGSPQAPVWALNGIDLAVPQGAILGLLGPNGAGKTTAARILTTLTLPDAGEARVAGHDVLREPGEVRRRIGVTAQDHTLDENLTGRQNLVMVAELSGLRRPDAKNRAAELLDHFGLAEAADRVMKTSPAGCGAGSTSPGASLPGHRCSSWTSRPPGSTRVAGCGSGTSSGSWSAEGPPCC